MFQTAAPPTEPAFAYFRTLFVQSLDLIDRFPITREPALMGHVTGVLEPAVRAEASRSPFADPDAAVVAQARDRLARAGEAQRRSIGLNTMGMLLDRLTILAMKHWNLVHRQDAPQKAQDLAEGQVTELLWALACAYPGQSSVNNKLTSHKVDAQAHGFAPAFFGLTTTNLLLWEAQELLYNHDILTLPGEELRAYITFFSRGNLERNAYIQASDVEFWRAVDAAEATGGA